MCIRMYISFLVLCCCLWRLFEVTTFTEFQMRHHSYSPYISNSSQLPNAPHMMTNIVPYRFDGIVNFQCTYYFTLIRSLFRSRSFVLFRFHFTFCLLARMFRIYVNYVRSLFWLLPKKSREFKWHWLCNMSMSVCRADTKLPLYFVDSFFFLTVPMRTKNVLR